MGLFHSFPIRFPRSEVGKASLDISEVTQASTLAQEVVFFQPLPWDDNSKEITPGLPECGMKVSIDSNIELCSNFLRNINAAQMSACPKDLWRIHVLKPFFVGIVGKVIGHDLQSLGGSAV